MALEKLLGISPVGKATFAAMIPIGFVVGFAVYKIYYQYCIYVDVDIVGLQPGLFGTWKAAFRYLTDADKIIKEGYNKHRKDKKFFQVACIQRYLVFPTDPKLLEEMVNAPSHVLSFDEAASDRVQTDYTLDSSLRTDTYHLKVIQENLTRRLSTILPEIVDEMTLAWKENTNIGDEWTEINIWDVMLKVIARTVNRLLVGVPLCRNREFLDNIVDYSTMVSRTGAILDMTPSILRWLVSWCILNKPKRLMIRNLMKFVGPMFEERKRKLAELGDKWTNRPQDAIQWILESAPRGSSTENMVYRILLLNFVAIHTTSLSITHVLYDLAAHQELHEPLKDEIESVLAEDSGWTKQGLTKMRKLDSALKESQRMNIISAIGLVRKAMTPYTFSDGTFVPKGTFLCAPSAAIHFDVYERPFEYDGFRYERLRKEEGETTKHQMVSTTLNHLPFGHGKHACPGRFFAANELKILAAYVIANYEFKTLTGKRPKNSYFGPVCIPDRSAKLLFRKRKIA